MRDLLCCQERASNHDEAILAGKGAFSRAPESPIVEFAVNASHEVHSAVTYGRPILSNSTRFTNGSSQSVITVVFAAKLLLHRSGPVCHHKNAVRVEGLYGV